MGAFIGLVAVLVAGPVAGLVAGLGLRSRPSPLDRELAWLAQVERWEERLADDAAVARLRASRRKPKTWRRCPACGERHWLRASRGELGEQSCARCGGRLLAPDGTTRLLVEHHGFTLAMLRALPADPVVRMVACPACRRFMVPRRVRGAVAHLCGTCGRSWYERPHFVALCEGRFS